MTQSMITREKLTGEPEIVDEPAMPSHTKTFDEHNLSSMLKDEEVVQDPVEAIGEGRRKAELVPKLEEKAKAAMDCLTLTLKFACLCLHF